MVKGTGDHSRTRETIRRLGAGVAHNLPDGDHASEDS
jgi:hypothetical protein